MKTKLISVIILFILFALSFTTIAYAEDPIVYSRCERTTDTLEVTADVTISGQLQTVTRTWTGLDIYDRLPDVSHFFRNFSAPCDLVYRDPDGVETIIYDCSSTSTDAASCAALDAAVSFDGDTIAFSVFHGSLENLRQHIDSQDIHPDATPNVRVYEYHQLPNKQLKSTGAHLHFYTVSTGDTNPIPFQQGIYDSGPTFISDRRVAFTSTRDEHTTTVVWSTTTSKRGTRIWTVDIDGKNPDLASHHSLSQEQHPYMLRDGRVAYSSWQIFGGLPFRHSNNGPGSYTTLDNLFHIYAQDPDGAGNFPIYGQHSGDHKRSTFGASHNAAHFLAQTSDDRVWFADYYRANNKGLGFLVGVMPEPAGQEGFHPDDVEYEDFYVPRDALNFASWTHNDDKFSMPMSMVGTQAQPVIHPNYTDPLPFAGKLGHPAALPGNGLMMAWGKGGCTTVAHVDNTIFTELGKNIPPLNTSGRVMSIMTALELDTPGCDVGIYRATQIPSQHPGDLEMIVDSDEWHEIMARAVVPYSAIFGVDKPDAIDIAAVRASHISLETGTPFGLLGAASIIDRETHPKGGIHFAGEHQFNLQGTDTIDYTDDDLCGIRILGNMPNRDTQTIYELANYAGERVAILGEFPVLHRHIDGSRVIDASGHPDTSFLVRMPANMPYLMQGIDCDGRTLNTDQTWQSLRPGEQKTCNGCHVHSKPARTQFDTTFAASSKYTIPRLGEDVVQLLTGKVGDNVETRTVPGYGMRIEFTQDIKPIFDQHCVSCHGGNNPAGGLALDNTGGNNKAIDSTWWCLVDDQRQECLSGVTLRRPQLTRYIRAFNSRGSLLYWKAANQRTDNRTDAQYADDIDFGADHPTTISADELGVLSRWIEIGAPGGSGDLDDTQKPTLHLAIGVGSDLSQLRVGTVDLGSGIDVSSLVVCVPVYDSNGNLSSCINQAGTAEKHGITVVNMGGLSDPDTEIYARVGDMAGNVTEVHRTVGWLQDNASGATNNGDSEDPSITIISPQSGAEVSGSIPIIVDSSDNVGVASVELYVNGQWRSRSAQDPFTLTLDTIPMDNANYTLMVTAFDAAGNQSNSTNSVEIVVNNIPDTELPTVSIASPTGGTVSGTIPIVVNAADNIGVTAVKLYGNGQLLSEGTQEQLTFSLDTTTLANGDYVLTADAFDAASNQGTTSAVTISVQNSTGGGTGGGTGTDTVAPTIFLNSPNDPQPYSSITRVTFVTSDNVGVARVELYAGDTTLVGSSTVAPFDIDWDTTQLSNSTYTIWAKAFDAAGNQKSSNSRFATVDNPTDTELPVISITSPTGGTVSGTIPIEVSATDNVGVASVELRGNGQLLDIDTQAPFAFTLDTATVANGNYVLTVHAFDAAGNQGTSTVVTVLVQNNTGSGDTVAPTIFMNSPDGAQPYSSITHVTFNTSDNVGVARVELYADGTLVGSSTVAPFDIDWDTTQLPNGTYTIWATAFDAAGNQKSSNSRFATLNNQIDTELPIISITSPTGGTVSGTIPVEVSATDNIGVTSVELYGNGQLLDTDTQAPFSFTLDTTTVADGNYSLTMQVYDAAGNQGTSTVVTVLVQNNTGSGDTVAPTIFLNSPNDPQPYSGITHVTFNTSDNVGVARVELYADGALVGSSTVAPFDIDWDTTQLPNGTYTIWATAFDAAGNQKSSNTRFATVDNPTDTVAPTIFMNSPDGAQPYSGITHVTFNTSDNVGVARVELYADGTLVGSSTVAPFDIDWDTTQIPNGTYTIWATAFDVADNEKSSNSRFATINN